MMMNVIFLSYCAYKIEANYYLKASGKSGCKNFRSEVELLLYLLDVLDVSLKLQYQRAL